MPNAPSFPARPGKGAARLDAPDGAARAYALFAHSFTCGKDVVAASRIARAMADSGLAVLRFDFTGTGSSEGEFAYTSFSSNVEGLVAAAALRGSTVPRRFSSATALAVRRCSLVGGNAWANKPWLPACPTRQKRGRN